MDDDFFEEEEGIFGEDEVFDSIMLDEMEKQAGKPKSPGCLTSIFFVISTISALGVIVILIIV